MQETIHISAWQEHNRNMNVQKNAKIKIYEKKHTKNK